MALALAVMALPAAAMAVAPAKAQSETISVRTTGATSVRDVKLGLNKAVVVDLPADAHDILVADPAVADAVTRSQRRIYLFGKAVGQTNVFVFGANGEQIVSLNLSIERDISGLEEQIARFIPDSDVKVEIISDNIVLTGRVRTPQDASRAAQLAEIFLKGGEATTRNITAVGGAGEGGAAIFAEQRQRSLIVNLLDIDGDDQVTLKVTVAEVSRQILKQLGFNTYLNSGTSEFQSVNPVGLGKMLSSTVAAFSGNIGSVDINAYVRAMEQAGVMKTLAEPSLTAISGEAADFYVGGEFWRVVSQAFDENGSPVYENEETEYGIRLEFTPVVLSAGRISLKVRTEVSEPTFEGSVTLSGGGKLGGITANGIRRREASTAVELPSGGSIVIAGLVQDNIRQVMGGLPGASKIPVLGTLFRSRDFVRNETELVIIATPYLVRPVARNKLARPDDNFNAASDGAGNFLGRVNRVYGQMETDLPKGRYYGVVGFIYK
ncbi:type II and III secretion system protein family protein [Hoeflea sp. WL0058]|uniref:Type II and III secretion system protein family protein n=1 Tax=Flavimaribacter sediminis TaxID=2865987 RepID=A0AAE2ZKB5_9HYPH|nr:type II and III secretion system protein family protein [Flavimaribacter sediminis]MBW8638088.1 type II and III secretion system protein family protein [Flavimaribacter sediminis]